LSDSAHSVLWSERVGSVLTRDTYIISASLSMQSIALATKLTTAVKRYTMHTN